MKLKLSEKEIKDAIECWVRKQGYDTSLLNSVHLILADVDDEYSGDDGVVAEVELA